MVGFGIVREFGVVRGGSVDFGWFRLFFVLVVVVAFAEDGGEVASFFVFSEGESDDLFVVVDEVESESGVDEVVFGEGVTGVSGEEGREFSFRVFFLVFFIAFDFGFSVEAREEFFEFRSDLGEEVEGLIADFVVERTRGVGQVGDVAGRRVFHEARLGADARGVGRYGTYHPDISVVNDEAR